MEQFSWRQQEEHYNNSLEQFRATLPVSGTKTHTRLHFIHVRSKRPGAVPLLLLPPFPFTNLSLAHLVPLFTEPTDDGQAFHVIIPSLPGLGFSDALPGNKGVISTTAQILDTLMKRLEYTHYLVTNTGPSSSSPADIDWELANCLATRHASSCLGAHLISPPLAAPTPRDAPWEWTKYTVAKFFRASILGYSNDDFTALGHAEPRRAVPSPSQLGLHHVGVLEPNTLAFALCDSPVGLLALLLKSLRTLGPKKTFAPADVVTMAMLAWLPGPEAALRFWASCVAHPERRAAHAGTRPRVAITVFLGDDEETGDDVEMANMPAPAPRRYACPGWANRSFDVVHTTRAPGAPGLLAWERPEIIAEGVARLAGRVLAADERLRPAPVTEPMAGVVVDGQAAPSGGVSAAEPETLRPPPVAQQDSGSSRADSWRLGQIREDAEGAGDFDASPNTLVVSSPGTSPSPLKGV